jgi:hypothetical protein
MTHRTGPANTRIRRQRPDSTEEAVPRKFAATGLVLAALLTGACAGGETDASSTGASAPASSEPPPEPFLAAGYPTPQDADRAFVSEVAALEGVRSYLTRQPYILATDLTAASAGLARLGRAVCSSYTGDNIDSVAAGLETTYELDNTIDPMYLDPIDASAFVVAAVGVYCPQKLADLGQGVAMTDGVEIRQVDPQCPTDLPITVAASPIELSGYSNIEEYGDLGPDNELVYGDTDGLYDGTWTYTVTNSSDYDVVVGLEERVLSRRYTTDWAAAAEDGVATQPPYYVPAHQSVTGTNRISGVYAWQAAEYRVATWLPVSCQVTLQ